MRTAASWTEVRRAVSDVAYLIDFRTSTVRRPRAFAMGAAVFVGLTLAAATLPAMVEGAGTSKGHSLDAVVLMPTAMAAFMFLAIASSVASGGGRELLHREHAVIYPVSPTTDHLGALLLAPLNIAWLLQAWILMGITAYGVERRSLVVGRDRHRHLDRGRHRGRAGRGVDGGGDPPHLARHRDDPLARRGAGCGRGDAPADPPHDRAPRRAQDALDRRRVRRRVPVALGGVDRGRAGAARGRRRARRDPGAPRRPPRSARRAAGRDRPLPGPSAPPLAAGHAGAHRPGLGLAGRAHAPRPRGPGDRSRRRGAGRQPGLAADDDPARAGGIWWCAAVRRQRLVPRRPRRSLAGEPAGRSEAWSSPPGRGCSPSSCSSRRS